MLSIIVLLSGVPLAADVGENQLARFNSLRLLTPIEIESDPYKGEFSAAQDLGVCGVTISDDAYRLATLDSEEMASQQGAEVTHYSSCGTCSTLQDLAVYLSTPDLTTPVRRCAVLSFSESLAMRCLTRLGFSEPCAKTWFYNARNTAKHCKGVCLKSWLLREPNNLPDGSLNACLACDENVSGPVFKATAGRTRRNSGIESAIGRDESETILLEHKY